jgi:MFS family permease
VLIVWNIVLLGSAAINVAEVFFAKETLDAGDTGFGVLIAASGVGLALGSYLAAPALGRVGLRRHYVGAIALMAIGSGAAAVSPTIWVAVPFVIGAAVGNGGAIVANQLLVQRGAPDRYRGRALATIMSSNYAFLGVAMAVAGVLTDLFGARWVWFGAGAVTLFAAVVALALTRWLGAAGREAEDEVLVAHAEAAAGALVQPEPAPEPLPPLVPEPIPETAPAAARSNDRAVPGGLERIATLLEEIERRRQRESTRRTAS